MPSRTRTPARRAAAGAAVAAALLTLAGCSMVRGADGEFRDADEPAPTISAEEVAVRVIDDRDLSDHVHFLASDDRQGRATPSPGLERSAAWIAEQFQRAGLEPAGDAGGFLQYWPLETASAVDSAVLVPNVAGRLPGADLTRAGEYVILVAHYDHVGFGAPAEDGDSLYNGADANASGVAALVEAAYAFGALPDRVPRPVLFLAVAGAEQGLLGSRWYAAHPTIALERAVAVLEANVVGRNARDSIGVVGFDLSSLGTVVRDVAGREPVDLRLAPDPAPEEELLRQSDALPFLRLGIPAIRLFSGFHDDYRTPSDEADRLDYAKLERVARLLFLSAYRLAESEIRPEWTEAGRTEVDRGGAREPQP